MINRADQEPAYVLHRRAWQESSLIVDLFTLNYGRMSVVARGGNRPKSPLKAQLQPFQPLLVNWQGRSEMKNLTAAEVRPGPNLSSTDRLYCGLYLNELLQRLLPPWEAAQTLFARYIETLGELAETDDYEPVLRRFEQSLAGALGWGLEWERVSDTGRTVESGQCYYYAPDRGILSQPEDSAVLQGLKGEVLQSVAADDLSSPEARRLAKRVMRALIDYLLQGRPLHSRQLFAGIRGGNR